MNEFTLIEAAGDARPKIVGTAYSGGKMSLPGWKNPVVVDLSGMELPESVPLLANHENRTSARVGMVSAHVKNNQLEITGEIISESSEAADIVAQSKAGADWQLSIGADVKECEHVTSISTGPLCWIFKEYTPFSQASETLLATWVPRSL